MKPQLAALAELLDRVHEAIRQYDATTNHTPHVRKDAAEDCVRCRLAAITAREHKNAMRDQHRATLRAEREVRRRVR